MGYSSIAWLPLCAGLTVLGLVLSYIVGRRRGYLSMLRGAAWSLLPIAAYLTGSVEMFWKIGVAIGHYADGFVFSPVKWAGVAVAGLSALLFFATHGRERRKASRLARRTSRGETQHKARESETPAVTSGIARDLDITKILREVRHPAPSPAGETQASGKTTAPAGKTQAAPPPLPKRTPKAKPQPKAPEDDDDMKDIEDILRKRGI
ncbi:MAG TPA: cellulose synthase [Trebonia sp.]